MDAWPRPRPAGNARTDAPYRIRPVAPPDLSHVAEIERRVFSDPWPEAGFRDLLGPFSLVAVSRKEEVAGYLFARCTSDEAEILNLAVHPGHRRRGLGTALVLRVLQDVAQAGARRVHLEVRASNHGAQVFYQRLGFEPRGRRRGYYSRPNEDALVLGRDLGEA